MNSGEYALLITALLMVLLHFHLFEIGWRIISSILYLLVQPVVANLLPKQAKMIEAIVAGGAGEELSPSCIELAKKTVLLNIIAQIALVAIVFFMVLEPFEKLDEGRFCKERNLLFILWRKGLLTRKKEII